VSVCWPCKPIFGDLGLTKQQVYEARKPVGNTEHGVFIEIDLGSERF
jgi:hypothetical protein